MPKQTALIIDDEADIRTLVALTLQRMGLECFAAENVAEARAQLSERAYHFCITDMKLPDGNGLELIRYCQKHFPAMPIAMITAYGNMELGVSALKAGAFDVLAKPIDTDALRALVHEALKLTRVPSQIHALPSSIGLLGESLAMDELKTEIAQVARTQAPVCVLGETGTGKELVARLIHHQSSRAQHDFIKVGCAGRNLKDLENELFAPHNPQESALYLANKGTLFLEEIGQLPNELQSRLLFVLQERVLSGGKDKITWNTDFRLLTSSSESLSEKVNKGQFRQDLFYRISVIPLRLLPLRERGDDILHLAQYFVKTFSQRWDIAPPTLTDDALQALAEHPFKGNIDELQSVLERALSLVEQDSISAADLQLSIELDNAKLPHTPVVTNNLEEYLQNIEREAIRHALETNRWNKTAAAAKLGLSFRTMRYRCKKLGID